jgi:hypothetical protein
VEEIIWGKEEVPEKTGHWEGMKHGCGMGTDANCQLAIISYF